jgi:ATP-binding cassette subfamily A (ABC1) protein 3
MFVVDFFLFLFLGFYLNNVLPHDFGIRKPFYFICTSDFWCNNRKKNDSKKIGEKLEEDEKEKNKDYVVYGSKDDIIPDDNDNLYGNSPNFESEEIYKNRTKKDDVLKIRNILKIFGDGKVAVDGVNLNFYKDEIFALLGHNGAGKTTLISMLTGLYEATQGTALYEGVNILDSMNMELFREKLGICPQHDILFQDLNIREHLEMFSIFKGVESDNVENEVNKTLHDFQLEEIQYMLAKNLSAGQRRKLSISISLIGGSKVIFLDEPSSGMDITSRRNLWEILKRQTDGKIIILTTHYMEEASVLGKRIGIINLGKMKCIGSPLFLIEKYGRFMSLDVTKEEDCDSEKIIEFMKSNCENIEYEALSEEIMFRIPIKSESGEKRKNFDLKSFFTKFDQNIKKLQIKSYSVSMPTLEDVFLNVAAEDNNNSKSE